MLTNEDASYLLDLDKMLKDPEQIVDLKFKKNRLELLSNQDTETAFWMEITTNDKVILKTSIHHLESISFNGLLRIDFKGGHRNPEDVSHLVPEYLRPYAGIWIEADIPHMHVYVEGYKQLAWAIPLEDTDFPIKDITCQQDLCDLITNFAKRINLSSRLVIQPTLF